MTTDKKSAVKNSLFISLCIFFDKMWSFLNLFLTGLLKFRSLCKIGPCYHFYKHFVYLYILPRSFLSQFHLPKK